MRETPLNHGWTFAEGFDPAWTTAPLSGQSVSLPHNAVDLPWAYLDEKSYQRPFTYQRVIHWDEAFRDHEVFADFEGAMADSRVWLNGEEVAHHPDGYTPFAARLTRHLRPGDNLLTVRVDGSENPAIPPFGGQIDYLTYAGIYREASLRVVPGLWIERLKIETPEPLAATKTVILRVDLSGAAAGASVEVALRNAAGDEIARAKAIGSDGTSITLRFDGLAGLALWDIDSPVLYHAEARLTSPAGTDSLSDRFGFREARFTVDGFVLNGRKLKLMGLNRHQSFPYSGYAQGRMSQRRDAEILKNDLACNIVRTSHYPQSRHFLDCCDEIGLLVFEEIPGWQHMGDLAWQKESVNNVRAMIERDWNRPAIIIWGVRINESLDNHDFYAETNRVARELDPTRQTGGVRFIAESELLEDVYTMNDFVMGQFENPLLNRPRMALRNRKETTGLPAPVPYLVTEFNGHMYPTKAWDQEQRQVEHVTRHLEVLDAMFGDDAISGCIGWCFYDYNTHSDFGSGDRICHHGVATVFREPKFAAYAYSSQRAPSTGVVLEPVTFFARGERNIGGVLPLMVLTNCDEVELHYSNRLVKRVGPDRTRFPHLPHAPVIIDHRHFAPEEMGLWGQAWQSSEVVGFINGVEVARRAFAANPLPTRLEITPDSDRLEATARDEVRVILRALDQCGNKLPFLPDLVSLSVTGPAQLIGPSQVMLAGGSAGFWLRATGDRGEIRVTVQSTRFAAQETTLQAV